MQRTTSDTHHDRQNTMSRRSNRLARPSFFTAEMKDEIYRRYYPGLVETCTKRGIDVAAVAAATEGSATWNNLYDVLQNEKYCVIIPVGTRADFTNADDKELIARFIHDFTTA